MNIFFNFTNTNVEVLYMKYVLVLDLILKYKNISVKELSIDSNISERYLYELVNNSKVNPTLDMLFQISYIINENVKNFFTLSASLR